MAAYRGHCQPPPSPQQKSALATLEEGGGADRGRTTVRGDYRPQEGARGPPTCGPPYGSGRPVRTGAPGRRDTVLGAHWRSWLTHLRGAPPVALDQALAAVALHQALDARPVQRWHTEGCRHAGRRAMQPLATCGALQGPGWLLAGALPRSAVAAVRRSQPCCGDCRNGGCCECGNRPRRTMPRPRPARTETLAPRDNAAVAAAQLAAPRRRRRPRRQRRAEGEADSQAAPADPVAPPPPPSGDPLQAVREVDLALKSAPQAWLRCSETHAPRKAGSSSSLPRA